MRKNLLLIPLLICNLLLFAQEKNSNPASPGKWVLDKSVGNVEFFYMIQECNGKNNVFLKLVNHNDFRVRVSWDEEFATQFVKNAKAVHGQKQIALSKKEIKISDCSTDEFKEGKISSDAISPTYVAAFQGFSYRDIKVTKLQ